MKKKLIVAIPPLNEALRARIARAAEAHDMDVHFYDSEQEALAGATDAEIIFSPFVKLAGVAPHLKWHCTSTAGVNQFLAPGVFASPDAVLTNSSGAYGTTIAEHIVMATLVLMRRQMEYTEFIRDRQWKRGLHVRSIRGSRVTFLGTGDIGQEAASRVRAFYPACITGINHSGRNPGGKFDRVATQDRMEEVLGETDLLILSLPGTSETNHLMNRERLAMMPKDAFLVNVGRGNVIDEAALAELLNAGHFAGVALDVFEKEPLPQDSPLWTCPRLLITPHVAGNMTLDYTAEKIVEQFLENLENYCAGRPLAHQVDLRAGY